MAEEMERELKAYGHVVMRVRIEPKSYLAWCAANARAPAAKDERSSSLPRWPNDTATRTDRHDSPSPALGYEGFLQP